MRSTDTWPVKKYVDWRAARPGLWLIAALVATVATYMTAADRSTSVLPWLLLDLWLARRVWRGGATALAWFRFLQLLGVFLFGYVLIAAQFSSNLESTAGLGTVMLFALASWCLLAPALSRHVAAVPVAR